MPSCINVLTESEVLASHPASVPFSFTEHCNMHCYAPDTCPSDLGRYLETGVNSVGQYVYNQVPDFMVDGKATVET